VPEDFADDVASVAALGEPVRRALYRYVVAQGAPVSREQAATGTGVAHHVAKFNLDRLVADGLLDVEYSRPPGRSGPGAGRPAKLYRRAARDISVSLPERRYDLAGHVMAEAITVAGRDGVPVDDALHAVARGTGRRLGESAEVDETAPALDAAGEALARYGYEPRLVRPEAVEVGGAVQLVLANCPFHRLAADFTQLVCGMNLDLVGGLVDAVRPGELAARLDPGPDRCCVTVATA
jgi:predicted ArsR family transcriptional regulator